MHDRVDEWVVSALTEFEGKPLHSVARGDLDLSKLGEAATPDPEKPQGEQTELVERMQKVLAEIDHLERSPAEGVVYRRYHALYGWAALAAAGWIPAVER